MEYARAHVRHRRAEPQLPSAAIVSRDRQPARRALIEIRQQLAHTRLRTPGGLIPATEQARRASVDAGREQPTVVDVGDASTAGRDARRVGVRGNGRDRLPVDENLAVGPGRAGRWVCTSVMAAAEEARPPEPVRALRLDPGPVVVGNEAPSGDHAGCAPRASSPLVEPVSARDPDGRCPRERDVPAVRSPRRVVGLRDEKCATGSVGVGDPEVAAHRIRESAAVRIPGRGVAGVEHAVAAGVDPEQA